MDNVVPGSGGTMKVSKTIRDLGKVLAAAAKQEAAKKLGLLHTEDEDDDGSIVQSMAGLTRHSSFGGNRQDDGQVGRRSDLFAKWLLNRRRRSVQPGIRPSKAAQSRKISPTKNATRQPNVRTNVQSPSPKVAYSAESCENVLKEHGWEFDSGNWYHGQHPESTMWCDESGDWNHFDRKHDIGSGIGPESLNSHLQDFHQRPSQRHQMQQYATSKKVKRADNRGDEKMKTDALAGSLARAEGEEYDPKNPEKLLKPKPKTSGLANLRAAIHEDSRGEGRTPIGNLNQHFEDMDEIERCFAPVVAAAGRLALGAAATGFGERVADRTMDSVSRATGGRMSGNTPRKSQQYALQDIARSEGSYDRNLRTLEYISRRQRFTDTEVVKRLHEDAVADLQQQYGENVQYHAMKAVLDSAFGKAMEVIERNRSGGVTKFHGGGSVTRFNCAGVPEMPEDEHREKELKDQEKVQQEVAGKGKGFEKLGED